MPCRRAFLQTALASSALLAALRAANPLRAAARQSLTQDQLLQFDGFGNLTLIHVTDTRAQLKPLYYREADTDIGTGEARGRVPHVVGEAFQRMFGIALGSPAAYALTFPDFEALARTCGRMGGFGRIATVMKAIRAARPRSLLLDGGDTWQGSLTPVIAFEVRDCRRRSASSGRTRVFP